MERGERRSGGKACATSNAPRLVGGILAAEPAVPQPIRTLEEFFAHAIAIEREAIARYAEFEPWFAERGEPVLAGLCGAIAREERKHHAALLRASSGLVLPPPEALSPGWLEAGSPEAPARDAFYRVAQPHHLLELALQGECNALAFFDWVACTSPLPDVKALARDMAREEQDHVRWVRDALEYHPV